MPTPIVTQTPAEQETPSPADTSEPSRVTPQEESVSESIITESAVFPSPSNTIPPSPAPAATTAPKPTPTPDDLTPGEFENGMGWA